MASKTTPHGEIIKEYVRMYKARPSRDIARICVAENPGVFKDMMAAYRQVRYYRGASGNADRRKPLEIIERSYIPETSLENLDPFVIDYSSFPLCIGADAHFPYHDPEAIDIFLDHAAKARTIVFLGDFADMYQASNFVKDPRAMRIADEMKMMKAFLAGVRRDFPNHRIIYKIGNHEDRLDTLIKTRAPELFGLDNLDLASAIGADESKIEMVQSRQMLKFGRLYGLHGHEVGRGVFSPVNPARGLYLKTKKSAICAHHHQTSEHAEKNLDDKVESCWTIGCLCNMKPDYAPVNRWNHGFAEITGDDDMYTVHNRKIINYRVV
ncbi:MAG TPA: hypothetical protein PLU93_09640 [Treponemataceae bacterium]|nr:hypothetical protein [Treponemataceae bacterium]